MYFLKRDDFKRNDVVMSYDISGICYFYILIIVVSFDARNNLIHSNKM